MGIELVLDNMRFVWIIILIVFIVIEAATMGLATIWFAIGALFADIAAWLELGLPLQIGIFLAVSILLIIFTRPIAVKKLRVGKEKNITQQIEGRLGIVTEAITPFGSGLVKVDGAIWTAIGETPEAEIPTGWRVQVVRIEGVKLIVRS
jgi:membrane protein implicated in regulation of membrane protease activity